MSGFGLTKTGKAQAFSMVEVMTGLLMLAVGVGGMAIAFQHQVYQSVNSRNVSQAAMIAQSVFNEMSASDPETWDINALEEKFAFNFNGEPVERDEAYYTVEIDYIQQASYYEITIGVEWLNWRDEIRDSGGGKVEERAFGYELNMIHANNYGDFE